MARKHHNPDPVAVAAAQREQIIHGPPPVLIEPSEQAPPVAAAIDARGSTIMVRRASGRHWLVVSQISQLLHDPGQLGGPWFVRCDGQQLPIGESDAIKVAQALGIQV